jgi:TM2 domain-containing membrane protein YozV
VSLPKAEEGDISPKSRLAVTLLSVLPPLIVPIHGIHRFYLGKIGTGILMLITLGGLWIWTIIDFAFAVSGSMKDKEGRPIKDWGD